MDKGEVIYGLRKLAMDDYEHDDIMEFPRIHATVRSAFAGLTKPERDRLIREWWDQMREDDDTPYSTDLIQACDQIMWMTEKELSDWESLLVDEYPFVANMRSFRSPGELVVAEIGGEYEGYQLNEKDSGAEQARDLLNNCTSWGEMIGAVVASFHLWSAEDQAIVRPALTRALSEAAQHGVDH